VSRTASTPAINLTNKGTIEGVVTPASSGGNSPVVLVNGASEPVLPNGTFSVSVLAVRSAYNVTAELNGYRTITHDVVVTPGNVSWTNFSLLRDAAPPPYAVIFAETGLPGGTSWTVTLDGKLTSSASTSVDFKELNGTYSFELAAVPGWRTSIYNGSIHVDGANVSRSINWWQNTYMGAFNESGLPAYTWWSVNISGGVSLSTANQTISFTEPNGTYSYTASAANKNFSAPSGTVTINGSRVFEPVHFSQRNYTLTFTEGGLPSGTGWSVRFVGPNGTSVTGGAPAGPGAISLIGIVNGSYYFGVVPVAGYNATPSSGTIMVNGRSLSEAISFRPSPSSESTFLGLPATEGHALLGGVAAAVVVSIASVLWIRRRKASIDRAEAPT
jgi:hypothetical protein